MVYVVGNHDAEVWWNTRVQRLLIEAGLVDVFALSYSASFESLPEQLVYCEHGNQFDPSNTLVDYANPLDTPVGAHIVTELVRPIGSGAAITGSLDLRDVSYVFPLAAIPDWIAGRIFYQFLGRLLRWLLAPLVIAYAAYEGLAAVVQAFGGSLALRPLFLELAYVVGLVVVAFVVVFLISRRTAEHSVSTVATGFPGQASSPERYREDVAIRQLLPAPGGRSASSDGREPLPPRDRGIRLGAHPCPRDVGADASRRARNGDRQYRLLASPTTARARPARRPARVRARLRQLPRPNPIQSRRGDGGAVGASQAGRAAAALDRTDRDRGENAAPAAARRRTTADGPAYGHARSTRALLNAGSGQSAHGRLTTRPISLFAGTVAMETPTGPERSRAGSGSSSPPLTWRSRASSRSSSSMR